MFTYSVIIFVLSIRFTCRSQGWVVESFTEARAHPLFYCRCGVWCLILGARPIPGFIIIKVPNGPMSIYAMVGILGDLVSPMSFWGCKLVRFSERGTLMHHPPLMFWMPGRVTWTLDVLQGSWLSSVLPQQWVGYLRHRWHKKSETSQLISCTSYRWLLHSKTGKTLGMPKVRLQRDKFFLGFKYYESTVARLVIRPILLTIDSSQRKQGKNIP